MKYSKQREEILKVVLNSSDHPNVNTIYERVRLVIPNISLGTVYRNLNTLYKNKLIRKINNPNGGDHYDKTLVDHAHIYCVNCNNMYDLGNYIMNEVNKLVETNNECKILRSEIIFTGLCKKCNKGDK